jgi:hypothetical protein
MLPRGDFCGPILATQDAATFIGCTDTQNATDCLPSLGCKWYNITSDKPVGPPVNPPTTGFCKWTPAADVTTTDSTTTDPCMNVMTPDGCVAIPECSWES